MPTVRSAALGVCAAVAGAGAGGWLSFFEPRHRLSLAWASSREEDWWYLRCELGF